MLPGYASGLMRRVTYRLSGLGLLGLVALGCASIPARQYGVSEIEWQGVERMSSDAIEACLVTREREATVLRLGMGSGKCGELPFDSRPPKLTLWTMPWSEWPVYDPAIFDVDKQRIGRWYRARGFYDARVTAVRTYADGHLLNEPDDCDGSKSDCKLDVMVQVQEGEPALVSAVDLESNTALPAELLERLTAALSVRRGQRFDEALYEADKEELRALLWNVSYARASVTGSVSIDPGKHTARVVYKLDPGPACVFGHVRVEGAEELPARLIVEAADIPEHEPYSYERVLDAEQAVIALGVFSSVQLKPQGQGRVVDLVALVKVGRLERWSAGIGIMSGSMQRSIAGETESVPQWDVHLSGAYENRDFLGGLRRLRVEDRPRLISPREFPAVTTPRLGNVLSVRYEQPATFERRTALFSENTWDFGPDPYQGFFRHDISDKLGLQRDFWRQRVHTRIAVAHDLYEITDIDPPATVSDYRLPYLEQYFIFDLRNDPQRPRLGAYFSMNAQQAFQLSGYGSWDYVRVAPDLRGYLPLMWDFVLAARVALGALFILDADPALDPTSERLGPQSYRLRGGGANSNRGFSAGTLGAGLDGGIRRFEGSIELRIPFGSDFGMALFGDIGDVNQGKTVRFDHLNAAVGFGLRYFTILGPLRFDAGWRIPGLQVLGGAPDKRVRVKVLPSAAHLTIGQAF